MSAQMSELSLLGVGVGTVLRLERDAWLMVKCLRQATNEYAPPPCRRRPRSIVPPTIISRSNHRPFSSRSLIGYFLLSVLCVFRVIYMMVSALSTPKSKSFAFLALIHGFVCVVMTVLRLCPPGSST